MKRSTINVEDLPVLTQQEKDGFYKDGEFKQTMLERINDAFDRIEEEGYGAHQNTCRLASRG